MADDLVSQKQYACDVCQENYILADVPRPEPSCMKTPFPPLDFVKQAQDISSTNIHVAKQNIEQILANLEGVELVLRISNDPAVKADYQAQQESLQN